MLTKDDSRRTDRRERALLVGFLLKKESLSETRYHLEELGLLADTAGARVIDRVIQQRHKPSPATLLGSGKLQEIKTLVQHRRIHTVIFDEELSPTQQKNIEDFLGVKVIDRTQLILDIFARRAQTAHARVQVELAQYQYFLPRLTRLWTHLERQRGGIGTRGPGEKEIETDRRIIRDRITRLKKQLTRIRRQKEVQRDNRGKLVRVALVGYTNAGKSTLQNVLAKSGVRVENKLFATLDTRVSRMVIKNLPFLLTDTVGFIHKLPHCLVESFKATLDEVRESDLLLHVIDLSHPRFREHTEVVLSTLAQLESADKPMISIYNKTDRVKAKQKPLYPPGKHPERAIAVSARYNENLQSLKEMIYRETKKIHQTRYPYDDLLFPDKFLAATK